MFCFSAMMVSLVKFPDKAGLNRSSSVSVAERNFTKPRTRSLRPILSSHALSLQSTHIVLIDARIETSGPPSLPCKVDLHHIDFLLIVIPQEQSHVSAGQHFKVVPSCEFLTSCFVVAQTRVKVYGNSTWRKKNTQPEALPP